MQLNGKDIEIKTISDTKNEGKITFDENDTLDRKISVKKNFSQVYQAKQLSRILEFSSMFQEKMLKLRFTQEKNSPMIQEIELD